MASAHNKTGDNRNKVQFFLETVKELSADISYYRVSAALRGIIPKEPDDAVQDEWHTMNVCLEKSLLVDGQVLGGGLQGAKQALSSIKDALTKSDAYHSTLQLEALGSEIQDILDNDHGFPDKCKLWNPHRDLSTLKEILDKARKYSDRDYKGNKQVVELEQKLQKLRQRQIIAWISRVQHADIHAAAATKGPGAARGPAAWLLEPEWFAGVFSLRTSGIEYIYGQADTGMTKSVSAVISQVQSDFSKAASEDPTKTFGVAYYYCSWCTDSEGRGHMQILRSLLKQLYAPLDAVEDRSPELQAIDMSIFSSFAEKQHKGFPSIIRGFSSKECTLLLHKLIKMYTRVAVVLEALDKCDEKTQSYLTQELGELIKATEGLCTIRVLISNEPEKDAQASNIDSGTGGFAWNHEMTGQTIDLVTEEPDTQGSDIVGGMPVRNPGWIHDWDGQVIDLVTGEES